ncbi:MAG: Tryptophan-tRNA ligase [Microgenomates group bacterium GW2011_GWA2_44_7]|nr:MAG: Tryptophan-tRNA ligase [Microgenomates group bacterium GW2011_GWA2_44_7]KKT78576.1 MAG: Tryptophan-tRNA ligase [Microgenomates group bacterium GW2011_GWB1_44_8]
MIDKKVQKYSDELKKLGIGHEIVEHPELKTPPEVMGYLGLPLSLSVPTLVMKADNGFIAFVRRGDTHIDMRKLRAVLGVKKLRMANEEEFTRLTGVPLGAATVYSPGLPTFIDKKVFDEKYLYGGTGSFVFTFKYKTEDLKRIDGVRIVDVTDVLPQEKESSGRRVFSGIQPSGNLHVGNYVGAIKHWVVGQEEGLNIFCIVDLHAITVPQDPTQLHEKSLELAAILLAAGIDPEKSILFIQSYNPDHANLGWILNCYLSIGQMNRMTQYKDKSKKQQFVSVGLFDYPALMAADILLYNTTEVPIGEDQKQHVELTRDVAERFNKQHGYTFVLPEPVIPKVGGRVMDLKKPMQKMSKSDEDQSGVIGLLDTPDEIREKVDSAVTDSGKQIVYDEENKPGISNLIAIYSQLNEVSVSEVERRFKDSSYVNFKKAVAEEVIESITPLQKRYRELRGSGELTKVLKRGAERAREISGPKLREVYEKIGFVV